MSLKIKKDAKEFIEVERLRHIVKTYSDHIPVPINMIEGEDVNRINDASALWTRPRGQIKDEQYKEFYHHVAHANDDPWATLHFRAEGVIEYSGLLYIPTARPFNIFHPDRKNLVKLYVKRVFITDNCEELLPSWLRFLRGVVDQKT